MKPSQDKSRDIPDSDAAEPAPAEPSTSPSESLDLGRWDAPLPDLYASHATEGLLSSDILRQPENSLTLDTGLSSGYLDSWKLGSAQIGEALASHLGTDSFAPLTTALSEVGKLSESISHIITDAGLADRGFSVLDATLPTSLMDLGNDWDSVNTETLGALTLHDAPGTLQLDNYLSPLTSPEFASAFEIPGLKDLGVAYGVTLDQISASTSNIFHSALEIPEAMSSISRDVGGLSDALMNVAGSLSPNVLGGIEMPSWLSGDELFPAVTGLMTSPALSDNLGSVLTGFDRLASWPEGISALTDTLHRQDIAEFGSAMTMELPAVVRRTAIAPRPAATPTTSPAQDTHFVHLAIAWVQTAAARRGIVLSPAETLHLVIGVAVAIAQLVPQLATIALAVSTLNTASADADRIVESNRAAEQAIVEAIEEQTEAMEEQTELIERLHIPPSPSPSAYVVVSTVELRAEADGASSQVGTAYPNQTVQVEAEEGEWSRVTFFDGVAGETRAGWVPSAALLKTDGG